MSSLPRTVALRHLLHAHPELSGKETQTAELMAARLRALGARVTTGLAGCGVLGVFEGSLPGPSILLRAELDALPIPESLDLPHASRTAGVAHKCGHDGHMAILDGVAARLAESGLARGRVGCLFQPAEETGAGAAAVLADPAWHFEFDASYALHNVPGAPIGSILCRPGSMTLASRGLEVCWRGREAHAAHPEHGLSPLQGCLSTAQAWSERARLPPQREGELITIVHAGVGVASAFGTAPGAARLQATLRSGEETDLDELQAELIEAIVDQDGITRSTAIHDSFPECHNEPSAVERVRQAARLSGADYIDLPQAFRWSEDFGHFLRKAPGALFGLGAGLDQPALHDLSYDFPDAALQPGIDVFLALLKLHSLLE
jgi:amidohydrolase